MTKQEMIAHQAAMFKAKFGQSGRWPKSPASPGYSGALGDVFVSGELADEMEAIIEEAFEQVDSQPDQVDDQSE